MPLELQYTQFLQDSRLAMSLSFRTLIVNLRNRTAEKRRRRNVYALRTWQDYYVRVFVVIFTWYYCVLVFYKKILNLSHKVCRLLSSAVLADEWKKRASREKANERKTEGKERGEPVSTFFKYLNPPTNPWTSWKNRFSCQNVKRCGVGEFHLLDMFVRLCAREDKWLTWVLK